MAHSDLVGLHDTWGNLRANPVFRRTLAPGGIRTFLRSPVARSLTLTAVALAAYEGFTRLTFFRGGSLTLLLLLDVLFAIVFWFLIHAVQHYFCWAEWIMLRRTGTLEDYLNSGLSRADVAMGVIMPSEIAERLSIIGVLLWFLASTDRAAPGGITMSIVLVILIFLQGRRLFEKPYCFLPDVENFLRRRDVLSLLGISFSIFVPLAIFFAIYYAMLWGLILLNAALRLISPALIWLIAFFLASSLSNWPQGKFQEWRLRRFYSRYRSFDDLFERYIMEPAD